MLALSKDGFGSNLAQLAPSKGGFGTNLTMLMLSKAGFGPNLGMLTPSKGGSGPGRWIWGQSLPKPRVLPVEMGASWSISGSGSP